MLSDTALLLCDLQNDFIHPDGAYGRAVLTDKAVFLDFVIEVVRRIDDEPGFKVVPPRWVVERTFAWLGRCRRLAKDWERSIASSTAWATIASIRMLTRRIANLSIS